MYFNYFSNFKNSKQMKSFLIMVAAVVVGVIVAGFVKTKLLKQTA